jgi:hypothetical protein
MTEKGWGLREKDERTTNYGKSGERGGKGLIQMFLQIESYIKNI